VVKSIVAIDGPRVRFSAGANREFLLLTVAREFLNGVDGYTSESVVKSIVAIDGPRVRFSAGANIFVAVNLEIFRCNANSYKHETSAGTLGHIV
jgi:hypothetical protein